MSDIFDPTCFTRRVSDEAYKNAIASNLIKSLKRKVFDYIWKHGPCTQSMAVRDLQYENMNSGVVSTRFSELVRMDVIEPLGKWLDPIHRRAKVTWFDVTGKSPIKVQKKTRVFWIIYSESSDALGYAGPDRNEIEDLLPKWKKKPGFEDSKIFKAQVVNSE